MLILDRSGPACRNIWSRFSGDERSSVSAEAFIDIRLSPAVQAAGVNLDPTGIVAGSVGRSWSDFDPVAVLVLGLDCCLRSQLVSAP